ncbi:VOC family protein [Arthrobacter sp. zg-Y1143]|uniref:VOC family protein n=1 Tax=Arthrobacter sp. zg-Y1143 TaxID=3049065 RepID=UPI0024C36522|nr:VOC family protein [Arthrobacter sp. zg-Y1143]MDK1327963.1 VOC family protein [Arthrobacter sp. zg-Y1143]
MRIVVTSIFVDDQDKALDFYTRVLGFEPRQDVPAGGARWLTVGVPGEEGGVELLLEPAGHPAVAPFTQALVADGIPFTSFAVDSVQDEYERLLNLGVEFTQPPTQMGPMTTAVFSDTVGNLIQIADSNG